jgi:Bacterial capsule synthesis protein PGA_cap
MPAATKDSDKRLTLIAGGDVAPVRQPVDRLAELVVPDIADRDFLLAQCERTYSERGAYQNWSTIPGGTWSRLSQDYASVWRAAGVSTVSVASNHALDWGLEPFFDTIDMFESWGITAFGGGHNEDEARRPAVLRANDVSVAVLAYNCVLRDGQRASGEHPGLSAIRCRTWYEPIDHQPGTPPKVWSAPVDADLADMVEDIRKARETNDSVVIYIHWGLRHVPKVIATYQPTIGHAAIDAGADVVIGHGPHLVKGIETYRGKTIFYSIGNFLTTGRLKYHGSGTQEWNVSWVEHNQNPDVLYGFPAQSRHALLPRLTFGTAGLENIEVLPMHINDLAQPRVLRADEPEFEANLAYLEWASDQLEHKLRVDGDRFVIESI